MCNSYVKQATKRKVKTARKLANSKKYQKVISAQDDSSTDNDCDYVCLVCLAPYSESTNEDWIRCCECKGWSHLSCTCVDKSLL